MFTNPLPVRLYTKRRPENLINIWRIMKTSLSWKYNGVGAAIEVGQQEEKNAQKFLWKRSSFSFLFSHHPLRCCTCLIKGGFPLSRNFYVRSHVNFMRLNIIETMYRRSRVNVKVEPRSTFTFTRGLSYIASISFTRVNFTCVNRTEKLRDNGNQPQGTMRELTFIANANNW